MLIIYICAQDTTLQMKSSFKNMSPLLQWLTIAMIAGLMALLGTFLSLVIVKLGYGIDLLSLSHVLSQLDSIDSHTLNALKLSQAISTAFLFIGTCTLVAFLYDKKLSDFYHLTDIKPWFLLLIAISIFAVAGPSIGYIAMLNDSLGISSGQNNTELIGRFMAVNTILDLCVNLVIFALIPAISEEMLFRGLVQKNLINSTQIPWLGILIASLIFSVIHMEWDYLLPRWYMGIILGVLYFTSRSLWLSILAHFINNASAAISFYLYHKGSELVPENPLLQEHSFKTIEVLGSFIFVFILLFIAYRNRIYLQNTFKKLTVPF